MSVRGSEQAVVTDFDEAFGQDVLKEATDKLLGGNGRESGPICGCELRLGIAFHVPSEYAPSP
jgi:hypothetical protein